MSVYKRSVRRITALKKLPRRVYSPEEVRKRTDRDKSALLTLSVKKFLLIVAMPFLNSR